MDFREWLTKDRGLSERQKHIKKHGVDPKTGLTHRALELSEQTGKRGGRKSRRRTARVWGTADVRPETD